MSFLSTHDIVIMAVGCVFLIIWLINFYLSSKYNNIFEGLDEKEYPLKDVYSFGYNIMEKIGYKYKSKFDRKLRSNLVILYDEKFVDYYIRVIYAQSISIASIVFLFAFIMYGFNRDIIILAIIILMAFVAAYYFMTLTEKKIDKRSEEILNDFTDIVSKLALLINAGMIMREAWKEVAYDGSRTVYLEMQQACEDMSNGISEMEAVRRFGVRCIMPEIKKFSSTIMQGIEKGNKELASMLEAQSNEVWDMKQQRVKRAGAQANTKLMLPMFIMFVGILVMIVIPIFTNLGF